jgi:hypothetical protein
MALPTTSLLAVPVALGLALGAAAIAGGFVADVLDRGFGWRQPAAIAANLAIVVGVVPAVLAIGNGSWHTPRTTMPDLLAAQLPADVSAGEYRALFVGDPRVMPVPARELRPGIAYAVIDAGPIGFTDRFAVPRTEADEAIERVLELVADGATLRAGRLLAPLGIRYVVVPLTDGVASTDDDPIPVPAGLIGAFQNQLDIGSIYGPPSLELFVNQAWFPVGAQLTGATAEASRLAGEEALARADVSGAVPSMIGVDRGEPTAANEVAPGVLHVAIPFDERITLEVGDRTIEPRPGFGVTTAFDVDEGGTGVLRYASPAARSWWLASQITLWIVIVIVAAGARAPFVRRRAVTVHDETIIDLGTDPLPSSGVVGEALAIPVVDADDGWPAPAFDEPDGGDEHLGALLTGSDVPSSAEQHDELPAPDQPTRQHDAADERATGERARSARWLARARPGRTGVVPVGDEADDADEADEADDEVDLAALVAQVDETERAAGGDGEVRS